MKTSITALGRSFLLPAFVLCGALSVLSESARASSAPVPTLALAWLAPAAGGEGGADSLVLSVRVGLPKGWYINSNAPLDSFLVATRVEAAAPGLEFGAPRYPAAIVEHSQAMAGNMSLFKGSFEATFSARATAAGKPEGRKKPSLAKSLPPTRVTLHYQSCDGTMCWPPKAVTVVLKDGVTHRE